MSTKLTVQGNPTPVEAEIQLLKPIRTLTIYKNNELRNIGEDEKFIADLWLSGLQNVDDALTFKEISLRFEKQFGRKIGPQTVSKWLCLDYVQWYIAERQKDEGNWTLYEGEQGKKRWLREMIEYRDGVKVASKMTMYNMDLIAKYMGYKVPEGGPVSFQANEISFNVTQADGKA